ncbi:uncharacterized protein LOC135090606 isoform X3 [Scylla paramamosain]|uniref:uncharacterized protein LOC135090606 isoform X3 n=1 Tax=Scylla paramamosain TaxID=85552 RepID=UPI003083C061
MSRGKRHEEGQGERGGAAPPWPPSAPGTSAMIPPPRDTLVHLSSEYKNIIRRLQKVRSCLFITHSKFKSCVAHVPAIQAGREIQAGCC